MIVHCKQNNGYQQIIQENPHLLLKAANLNAITDEILVKIAKSFFQFITSQKKEIESDVITHQPFSLFQAGLSFSNLRSNYIHLISNKNCYEQLAKELFHKQLWGFEDGNIIPLFKGVVSLYMNNIQTDDEKIIITPDNIYYLNQNSPLGKERIQQLIDQGTILVNSTVVIRSSGCTYQRDCIVKR